MDDLLQEFVAETRETLEALSGEIVAWEAAPADRARLDAIFRFVHTVKGSCGFLDPAATRPVEPCRRGRARRRPRRQADAGHRAGQRGAGDRRPDRRAGRGDRRRPCGRRFERGPADRRARRGCDAGQADGRDRERRPTRGEPLDPPQRRPARPDDERHVRDGAGPQRARPAAARRQCRSARRGGARAAVADRRGDARRGDAHPDAADRGAVLRTAPHGPRHRRGVGQGG